MGDFFRRSFLKLLAASPLSLLSKWDKEKKVSTSSAPLTGFSPPETDSFWGDVVSTRVINFDPRNGIIEYGYSEKKSDKGWEYKRISRRVPISSENISATVQERLGRTYEKKYNVSFEHKGLKYNESFTQKHKVVALIQGAPKETTPKEAEQLMAVEDYFEKERKKQSEEHLSSRTQEDSYDY